MLKDSPPGPDLGLKELEAIAREAPRRFPGLAPLGGTRWTREDIDLALSLLHQETEGKAYERAAARGMTRPQRRRWLLTALRNRLLKLKATSHGIELLEDLALDRFPSHDGRRAGLDSGDAAVLAGKVLAKLRTEECNVLLVRLHEAGILLADPRGQADGMPESTRGYRWARVREIIRGVASNAGLRREECLSLLVALAARLTGGGQPVGGAGRFHWNFRPLAD